jgi:hypothetical protein
MHTFHQTDLNGVSGYQIVANYDLTGYRDFNFQIWAQGLPGANFSVLVYFSQIQGFGETRAFAPGTGSCIIQGTLSIYAPQVAIHVIGPATPYTAKVRLYAACCNGDSGKSSSKLKRASSRILRRVDEDMESFLAMPAE